MHRPGDPVGRILACCWFLTSSLLLTGVVSAQSLNEARFAYAEGRFVDAVQIGEALGTSPGFALAAESLTTYAHFIVEKGDKTALYERAIALAEEAVRLDTGNAIAHLQLAHALGRYAQGIGRAKALFQGYAEKIRSMIDNALRLDPDLSAAHLSLGLWHAELISSAGSFMARVAYGAREKAAIASFKRAFEIAPDVKAVSVEYARGLLLIDDDRYRATARDLLKRTIELPVNNAYDRICHERAVKHLEALDASDH